MLSRLKHLQRYKFLSPQITLLAIVGLLLLATMLVLGGVVIGQIETNHTAIGFNYSTVNRPFSQLDREILLMLSFVQGTDGTLDAKAFQEERDVLSSRWDVLFWEPLQEVFPQEISDYIAQMKPMWDDLQSLLDQWQTAPADETLHDALVSHLQAFELLVFKAEVRHQSLRGIVLDNVNKSTEVLQLVIGIVSFLLVGFVVVSAISIYRFFLAQQKAESETRQALAAEAAAVENSRFKDQFLAVMSHELRTPLNAIIGFLGIMNMSGNLDERNTHMVQRTRANAQRLLSLINDILDISKIESGRFELNSVLVQPRELVKAWQFQMDVLAKQKDINFSVEVDPSLPAQIFADDSAITKVATNLLSNAFKFTDQGEVNLKLERQETRWVIEVSDSGIGIPAHMHEAIFESFRQVDNSFKRAYNGTGLGLSIVQHLVKAMNGTIQLRSTVGAGSTFTVTLPLITGQAENAMGSL